jgi:uncharacterized integral membrane protein
LRTVTLGLVIVALVVLAIGLAGSGTHVDVRYIAGTWHQASLFELAAIVAGLVLVCGLAVAFVGRLGQAADRKVLEEELQRTYVRLRHAEAALRASSPVPAAADPIDPRATSGEQVADRPDDPSSPGGGDS